MEVGMEKATLVAALLGCASCAGPMPWSADANDFGRRPGAGAIEAACNRADRRPTPVDAPYLTYVVRDPICTADWTKRGDVQCRFELGETRVRFGEARSRGERRISRWRAAVASLKYSEQHFSESGGEGWMEVWTAVEPCRPMD
jgi:hypothetical protein